MTMTGKKIYNSDGRSSEDKALDKFAEMMIEKIKTLQNDWKKPWFTDKSISWPRNLSGREYNGMNALLLMMHCEKQGYKLPVFCTFDRVAGLNYTKDKQGVRQQIKDNNGQELPKVSILKGERSFPVFITTFTVVDKETKEKIKYDDYKLLSEEEKKNYNVYPKLQVYNVFNVHQTNLQEARPDLYKKLADEGKQIRPQSEGEELSFVPLDRIIKDNGWICPIKPTYGDSAYYSISKNEIVVPEKKQFKDGESFYTNLGHEMAHSTGAENQLGRLQPTSFGSKEYAREELVAELSAALVAQRYGMTKHLKEDSASYLKSWLDSLNESPEFIKTTLTDVKKASSMITKCIDAMQQKIDQEQNIEAGQSKSQEPVYYASVAYLQMGEDTDRLDKLQEKGDYETLLKEAIEYDTSDAIDLSNTYLSPTKYRGDDLLVENEHYAVVYNPSIGGTYDIMRKVSGEEVRQNITRYGLPDNATADVKFISEKQEQKMEAVAQEEIHYHRGR
nr:zincin-like metallopeptidase domain-containing protein [uncultured Bacteroides sp.]